MPSRVDGRRASLMLALLLGATAEPGVRAAEPAPAVVSLPAGQMPDAAQVDRALADLVIDPNLPTERETRTLRWKDREDRRNAATPGWLEWLEGLFSWIGQSGRLLVWALAIVLAALLAVYLLRLMREKRAGAIGGGFVAPTHVRDLDIRPESLPDDIGAAARALWEQGEHRRALALLYRGLLSRLAHRHRAPIRDSSTEGECLALAQRCLPVAAAGFAGRLILTWQRAVYGGTEPAAVDVHGLCEQFHAALDAAPGASA